MSIRIEPLAFEDLGEYCRIEQTAFVNDIGAVLFDGGDAATPETFERHLKELQEEWSIPRRKSVKAVDVQSGEIMGVATFDFFDPVQSQEELEERFKILKHGDEGYNPIRDEIIRPLKTVRRRTVGMQGHMFVLLLACDPKWHRRGAGSMLLEWGTREADERGLQSFVAASIVGRPVYSRKGFEVVDTVQFDMTQFGRTGTDTSTLMLRPARTASKEKGSE